MHKTKTSFEGTRHELYIELGELRGKKEYPGRIVPGRHCKETTKGEGEEKERNGGKRAKCALLISVLFNSVTVPPLLGA